MKAWLTYWLLGCAVVGFPVGSLMKDCPNAKIDILNIVGSVAIWPTIIFSAISRGKVEPTSVNCTVS